MDQASLRMVGLAYSSFLTGGYGCSLRKSAHLPRTEQLLNLCKVFRFGESAQCRSGSVHPKHQFPHNVKGGTQPVEKAEELLSAQIASPSAYSEKGETSQLSDKVQLATCIKRPSDECSRYLMVWQPFGKDPMQALDVRSFGVLTMAHMGSAPSYLVSEPHGEIPPRWLYRVSTEDFSSSRNLMKRPRVLRRALHRDPSMLGIQNQRLCHQVPTLALS